MYDDPADEDRHLAAPRVRPGRDRPPPGRDGRTGRAGRTRRWPPERLGAYLRDFRALLDRHGYDTSTLRPLRPGLRAHCRINFDLRSRGRPRRLPRVHGGGRRPRRRATAASLSGEHGDGQSRGRCCLDKMFGPELVHGLPRVQGDLGPGGPLNPGKVVEPYRIDENLARHRLQPAEPEGALPLPRRRRLVRPRGAALRRRGQVPRHLEGTMCPSFMVTLRGEALDARPRPAAVRDARAARRSTAAGARRP